MPFQIYQSPDMLAKDALAGVIPAPPGRDVAPFIKELAQELSSVLKKRATLTPWAVREGDIRWAQVIQPSVVNVEVYELSDSKLREVYTSHFMLELPYVAAAFDYPPLSSELEQAFAGTSYEPAEVVAMYSQADGAEAPQPAYLVWLKRRDADKKGSVEQAALKLKGQLLYAQQVPAAGSTKRRPPSVSYTEAAASYRTGRQVARLKDVVLPDVALPPVSTLPAYRRMAPVGAEPAVPAAPAKESSMTPYYLLGAGILAGALMYLVVRKSDTTRVGTTRVGTTRAERSP